MEVTGTIKQILDIEQGTSKAGKEWKKQGFVLYTGAEYNPEVCFSIFGDEKVDNFLKFNKVGDNVTVEFNLYSREYNGKWFHNLDAWMVKKNTSEPETKLEEEKDDLPF